jgi:hypothetical protein
VNVDFALDSSGFSTSNFGRYVDLRFGKADVIDRRTVKLTFGANGISASKIT